MFSNGVKLVVKKFWGVELLLTLDFNTDWTALFFVYYPSQNPHTANIFTIDLLLLKLFERICADWRRKAKETNSTFNQDFSFSFSFKQISKGFGFLCCSPV